MGCRLDCGSNPHSSTNLTNLNLKNMAKYLIDGIENELEVESDSQEEAEAIFYDYYPDDEIVGIAKL